MPAAMRAIETNSGYRPDIDGLRALAVVPVVLFHAGLRQFGGGYIGVDVFFVISGFLITGIIVKDIDRDRFSIAEFYRRRARRILPALTAMIVAVLLAGYAILPPRQYEDVGQATVWIAGFLSNFFFWKNTSYFDAGSSFEPLLHTWSLAVEEQFYIFFPILLLILAGKRARNPVILALLAASFILSCVAVARYPGAAFYLLPSRGWQLLLGGMLALGMFPAPPQGRPASLVSAMALALIVVPMVLYDRWTPFPGLAAVPPSLGAVLLIWTRGVGPARLLSARPVVAIGLASYSIYLWHMPIIEFAKYLRGGQLELGTALALSLASIGVGFLSLRYIEQPFRHGSAPRLQTLAGVAFASLGITAALGMSVLLAKGFPGRISPTAAKALAVAQDQTKHPVRCLSVDNTWIDPTAPCLLGKSGAPASVLLWGDSHAMVTATAMERAALEQGAAFAFAADADCPIGLGFAIDPTSAPTLTGQGHYRRCAEYNLKMLARAADPAIRTVVLSSRWTNWRIGEPANPAEAGADVRLIAESGAGGSNRAIFEAGFLRLVDRLREIGKKVVVVGPLPEPTYNVPERAFLADRGMMPPPPPLTLAEFRQRHAVILRLFDKAGVDVIRPETALCRDGLCPVADQGRPLYFDHNHLSIEGALRTAPLYTRLFNQADPHYSAAR